jgi:TRAP-type transport system periplasmic protein
MYTRFRPCLLALALLVMGGQVARAETVIRVGTVAPEGSRFAKDLRAMTGEIERLSGGEVRFKWFMGGRYGDEKAMAATLMDPRGNLDGVAFSGIGLPYIVPEMKVWIYPGLFQNVEEVDYLEHRYQAEFVGYFEREGLLMLTWAEAGFNYLHCDEKFDTFEALKKRRLWLWADDVHTITAANALGVQTDSTKLGELHDWLRDKKVDVWAYPPLAVIAMGLQKYSRYMSDMPFTFLVGAFVMRKDVFAKLPPDSQRAIRAIGDKWGARLTRSWRAEAARAVDAMKKQGTKIVPWSDAEKQRFFQAAAAERGNVAKMWGLEALMKRFASDLDLYRQARRQAR